jgi:hypothetical protein
MHAYVGMSYNINKVNFGFWSYEPEEEEIDPELLAERLGDEMIEIIEELYLDCR